MWQVRHPILWEILTYVGIFILITIFLFFGIIIQYAAGFIRRLLGYKDPFIPEDPETILCTKCGYNLRGLPITPDKPVICPECGTPNLAHPPSATP
ncbi:MAG: hypothetical protein K0S38_730 [Candidatus Paceibacter sp.]|jgi:hypothetical protein|nr:hypothetical protein [Candidatus Paceibacter sp.]